MKPLSYALPLLLLALAGRVLAQTAPAPTVLRPGARLPHAAPRSQQPDRLPEFPGGEAAMGEFFAKTVQIPARGPAAHVRGTVLVQATVGADGLVANPTVAQPLNPLLDAEALRVVRLLPAFRPAMRRGQPVPVLVQLPVPFDDARVVQFEKDTRVPKSAKDAPGLN